MITRDDAAFADIYGGEEWRDASTGPEPITPDPAAVAAAEEGLAAAEQTLEALRLDLEAAQDALVAAEGTVAVLETKVVDLAADKNTLPWQQLEAREELASAGRDFTRAGERLTRAEQKVAAAESRADEAAQTLQQARATPAPAEEPVMLRFASLTVFVEDFVLPNWVHHLGDGRAGRWCTRWWEHAEAVTRLEAIWEAFEVMRLQPAPSYSTWLRDHFDVHMRMLTVPEGTFHRCDADGHRRVHELKSRWATDPTPAGMFPVEKNAIVQPRPTQEKEWTNE